MNKNGRIKTWENKIKRLYSSDSLSDIDIKYLNLQFEYYKLRKSYNISASVVIGVLIYNFPYLRDLHPAKRYGFPGVLAASLYIWLKGKNRLHFESLVIPYFEKYCIK